MLAVTPLRQLTGFLPVIVVILIVRIERDFGGRVYGLLAAVLVVLLTGTLRWFTTTYRITSERVELRSLRSPPAKPTGCGSGCWICRLPVRNQRWLLQQPSSWR
jgi:hypothetical protein